MTIEVDNELLVNVSVTGLEGEVRPIAVISLVIEALIGLRVVYCQTGWIVLILPENLGYY